MKVGDYKNQKAREIIEDAISQLMAVGLPSDGAASLMVIQGMIRIEDPAKRKDMAEFAAREAEDTID
ncbi:MAG: hypothetical protein KUA43_08590 [Hoeflea sp.]|uniref:hypothetical protein n=1 Tax=Hoeflea sp. TaxID=1940281 RepID=UPI001DA0CC4D|nr:hypothetical protein [Hoeflea sp.]MBU4529722.1 hypothetical protein [Alphaproteobacteria bacterium]MBU4543283.1 hypothetical protein [Alphaproteobacteria bacterium]MBU4552470.1 hypothetical protein [Alphaproteobacteria bacterium]MBV1723486.1 hypothetical protein [Hoeflea sp.]MBV1762935.1 hypothetical protein [Hoeflea sp.]